MTCTVSATKTAGNAASPRRRLLALLTRSAPRDNDSLSAERMRRPHKKPVFPGVSRGEEKTAWIGCAPRNTSAQSGS